MFNQIRGVVELEVIGNGYEKLLNDAKDNGIIFFDIKVANEKLYIKTYKKNIKKIEDISKRHGLVVNIISKKGFIFKIIKYKRRYGILLGAAVLIFNIIFFSNIVLKVSINGNEKVSDDEIMSFLDQNGVKYWSFIPDIDMDNLGRKMYIAFDDISWATVRNSGGILIVDIREETKKPEMVPINQKCNVISDKNAQIIKINVFSGTAAVSEGDGVAKGSVLISGIVTDKFGKSEAVRADGEIIARYQEEVCFYQPLEHMKMNEVGTVEKKSLCIWGKSLWNTNYIPDEKAFTHDRTINYFSFLSLKLPIGILKDTYHLYEYENAVETPISAEKICFEKIKDYEYIFYSDKTITDKHIIKENDNSGIKIRIVYTIDSEIGFKQNIII